MIYFSKCTQGSDCESLGLIIGLEIQFFNQQKMSE